MLYARDLREFKCVQGTCLLLGWPCDHSQRSGLLRTFKPPKKAADGIVPHVQRLQCFQNPHDGDVREHGTQGSSYGRTSEPPSCAQRPASSVLFRSGHSRQKRIDCNWFCTLFQMTDGQFHPAAWVEEKRLLMVLCDWSETRKLCCFSTRLILSETALSTT